MSSIAIIQQQDAIHMITDAAHYTRDGVVGRIASKVGELPASNCAFSARGASFAHPMLEWLLARFASFDDIVDALAGIMAAIDTMNLTFSGPTLDPVGRHFIVTVAGWSERWNRFAAAAASTYEPGDAADTEGWMTATEGYRRYQPIHMPALGAMPPVDVDYTLGRTLERTLQELEQLDPAIDGLAIFEAQRICPSIQVDGVRDGVTYLVGGFAELTTISRDGIVRQVLKEYPDEVGALIEPEGAEPASEVWGRFLEWRAANPEWYPGRDRVDIAA